MRAKELESGGGLWGAVGFALDGRDGLSEAFCVDKFLHTPSEFNDRSVALYQHLVHIEPRLDRVLRADDTPIFAEHPFVKEHHQAAEPSVEQRNAEKALVSAQIGDAELIVDRDKSGEVVELVGDLEPPCIGEAKQQIALALVDVDFIGFFGDLTWNFLGMGAAFPLLGIKVQWPF